MGFFMGRMLVKQDLSQFLLGAMTIFTIGFAFFMTKYRWGVKKAWLMVVVTVSAMLLGMGVTSVIRTLTSVYHTNPSFHAKVNAYLFMDARYQAQLDPQWFEKKRAEIARYTLDLQRMRSVCGDPVRYREVAHYYNSTVDQYNKVIIGSMVGSQYAEPVRQLLAPQFNDQLVPCGSVFNPL
jgi:hypothetical protein